MPGLLHTEFHAVKLGDIEANELLDGLAFSGGQLLARGHARDQLLLGFALRSGFVLAVQRPVRTADALASMPTV